MTGYVNIPEFGSASWKEPVANVASLPASGNNIGDARVAKATQEIYIWDGAAWQLASGSGGIVSINGDVTPAQVISGTAPMSASTALGTTTVSISQASALTDGYLSSADWTTFNNKQPAGSYATTTLNNLGTTAINADLNLGTNAISRTNYTISPQLYDEGTKTGNFTLNWANGPAQKFTINAAGPLVITLSNPVTGGTYLVRIEQGATPGTVTWPSSVKWGTVGAPVLSNATGEVDVVTLFYDGVDYRASAVIQDAPPAANYSLTNLSFAGTNEQVLALGSSGPYWATEGVKTGYPANTVVVGRLRPAGLVGTTNYIIGTGTSGNALTSAVQTIIIGHNSGSAVATPDNNVIVGHFSGQNITGAQNTIIGNVCGNNITSGTWNVCIGISSSASATVTGSVCIGLQSGCSGNSAVALGRDAAAGAGAIALGAFSVAAANVFSVGSSTTQINTMYLGRGGATQTAANAVTIMTMQASGTDTDLSAGTLTLAGSRSTGNKAGGDVIIATAPAGASGTTLNAHVERMRVTAAGDVGIGTSTPNVRLEVQNTTATTNAVTNVLRVDSQSSGTPAVGIGVGIQMSAETAAGNTEVGVVLEAVTTDVTAASEDFDLVVKNMTNGAAATEKVRVASTGTVTVANGDLVLNTAGNGINIKEGANARMGITDPFPTGNPNTVTVSTTEVTANSRIFLTAQTNPGGNPVELYISARNAGTNFSITAHSNSFDGAVAWLIMEPA